MCFLARLGGDRTCGAVSSAEALRQEIDALESELNLLDTKSSYYSISSASKPTSFWIASVGMSWLVSLPKSFNISCGLLPSSVTFETSDNGSYRRLSFSKAQMKLVTTG